LLPSLVYLYSIYVLGVPEGNLDLGATLGSYFGLLIAAFSAVGILASSLSSNQIMAYLLGVFLNFILYFGIEQLANFKFWEVQIISFKTLVFIIILWHLQEVSLIHKMCFTFFL
jgi:hypothetical protein